MRVLFLAPQPFFIERGTPIAVKLAVAALCGAGHHVDLVTFHGGSDVRIDNLRHFRIARPPFVNRVPIGFSVSKVICDLWLAARAYGLIRTGRYDVVHAVEEAVFLALAARPFKRFQLVYDMDSLMSDQLIDKWSWLRPLRPILAWWERLAVRRADLVLPVCRSIADRVAPFAHPRRLHLMPDAVLEQTEGPCPQTEDLRARFGVTGPLMLYVGNLEAYQGIDLLLDGLALLAPSERCHLVIIGGNDEAVARYSDRVSRRALGSQVHLAGPRPLAQLNDYLAQADILCSPRLKGVNTPMKIYSYMASGRAILATDILSHTQVLDESTALLVPPTPEGIARGLRTLLQEPDHRARIGQNAALHARSTYSISVFRQRLEEAYACLGSK
jgi:glycosyltransferase involved in cell wall biosynthesis